MKYYRMINKNVKLCEKGYYYDKNNKKCNKCYKECSFCKGNKE